MKRSWSQIHTAPHVFKCWQNVSLDDASVHPKVTNNLWGKKNQVPIVMFLIDTKQDGSYTVVCSLSGVTVILLSPVVDSTMNL